MGEFRCGGFSDDDRACSLERPDDIGIALRDPVFMRVGAQGGPVTRRGRRIFQRNWNAMQRTKRVAARHGLRRDTSGLECLVMPDEAEAVQLLVHLIDTGKAVGDHLNRRDRSRGDHLRQVHRRCERQIEIGHGEWTICVWAAPPTRRRSSGTRHSSRQRSWDRRCIRGCRCGRHHPVGDRRCTSRTTPSFQAA